MQTILQINASLNSVNGESSKLADDFVAGLKGQHPRAQVILRDLAREPVPHLDAERFGSFIEKKENRTGEQQAIVEYSDRLIAELKRADAIVIGLPMYNFGVPSQLKAWMDHVARAGVTFRYTEKGPVGLLTGKKAWVLATRGGRYAGIVGENAGDHETPFMRQFLGFLGITEVEFVYAEGLAIGEDSKREGLACARRIIQGLANELKIAA